MVYQSMKDLNLTGLDGLLQYIVITVPLFPEIFSFAIYLALFLAAYASSANSFRKENAFAASTVSSFIVVILLTIISISGILTFQRVMVDLIIYFGIFVVSAVVFFLTDKD